MAGNLGTDVVYMILSKLDNIDDLVNAQRVSKMFYKASQRLKMGRKEAYFLFVDETFDSCPIDLVYHYRYYLFKELLQEHFVKKNSMSDYCLTHICKAEYILNGNKVVKRIIYKPNNLNITDRTSYEYLYYGYKKCFNGPTLLRYLEDLHFFEIFENHRGYPLRSLTKRLCKKNERFNYCSFYKKDVFQTQMRINSFCYSHDI